MAGKDGKKQKYTTARVQKAPKQKKRKQKKKKEGTLFQRIGNFLYRIGYFVEIESILLSKKIVSYGYITLRLLDEWLEIISDRIGNVAVKMGKDVIAPFSRFRQGINSMKAEAKGGKGVLGFYIKYFTNGIKKHSHLLKNLTEWAIPLATFALCAIWININLNTNYALAIEYNGEVVGYVENDAVYESAVQQVQTRIVYVEDASEEIEPWTVDATLQVQKANVDVLLDDATLADTILEASGEEIIEATGLYVDGVFYGATTEPEKLLADIAAAKAPYEEPDDPNVRVEFVNDVQVVEGIYLVDSVRDYDTQMSKLFTEEVEGTKYYTVEEGDSPLLIASKNGLTFAELRALNPDHDFDKGGLWAGDQFIISNSRMMLSVKVVVRKTRNETVPMKIINTQSPEMYQGEAKTITAGNDGVNLVTFDEVYIDNVLSYETIISTEVVVEMVPRETVSGSAIRQGGGGVGSGSMIVPLPGGSFRRSRGFYVGHTGTDLAAPYGTPIYAADSGYVTKAVYTYTGYGVHIIIDHGNGVSTLYGHCSALYVSTGQYVSQGQVIAAVGSTGWSTGNHIHFEVRINNTPVNPAQYIGY